MVKGNPPSIILKIEDSRNAARIERANYLYQEPLEACLKAVERIALRAEKDWNQAKEAKKHCAPVVPKHHTIAVLGGRGTGKTTFLRTLTGQQASPGGDRVEILPMFEPDHIASHEVPLVSIFKHIDESLNQLREVEEILLQRDDLVTSLDLARRRVIKALPAIHQGAYEEALKSIVQTPELAGNLLAERAEGSAGLLLAMHQYIVTWLTILRETTGRASRVALLLPLDDIDTRFEHGATLLETIRRFLCFPQLITVATGDLNLFDLIVRIDQAERAKPLAASNLFGLKRPGDAELLRLTKDQYLSKIFPIENRVLLPSPDEYLTRRLRDGGGELHVIAAGASAPLELKDLLDQFELHVLLHAAGKRKVARLSAEASSLFCDSLRGFLDVLEQALVPCAKFKAHSGDAVKVSEQREVVVEGLLSVLAPELGFRRIDLTAILRQDPMADHKFALSTMRKPASEGESASPDELNSLYNLSATYTSLPANQVATAALAVYNHRFLKFPGLVPQFWIVVVESYLQWEKVADTATQNRTGSKSHFIEHLHLARGDQAPDIVGRAVSWAVSQLGGTRNEEPRGLGTLRLQTNPADSYRFASHQIPTKIGSKWSGQTAWHELLLTKVAEAKSLPLRWRGGRSSGSTAMDPLSKGKAGLFPLWNDLRWLAPLAEAIVAPFVVLVPQGRKGLETHVAFARGIAMIADILANVSNEYGRKPEVKELDTSVATLFRRWKQPRVYPVPMTREMDDQAVGSSSEAAEGDDFTEIVTQPSAEGGKSQADRIMTLEDFLPKFSGWCRKASSEFAELPRKEDEPSALPPGDVQAAIWRRFHYNLAILQVDPGLSTNGLNLGDFLRTSTLAFFHSLLTEELIYQSQFQENRLKSINPALIDADNLDSTAEVFWYNLGLLDTSNLPTSQIVPYTGLWLKCPLLRAFVSEQDLGRIDKSLAGKGNSSGEVPALRFAISSADERRKKRKHSVELDASDQASLYPILCAIPAWSSGGEKGDNKARTDWAEAVLSPATNP